MKKLNKDGSVLISVVSIVLLILIILGITLAIANSYQQRAINDHAKKQAYLNGVSIAETIAGQIYEGDKSWFVPNEGEIIELNEKDEEFDEIKLPEGYAGKVSVTIRYSNTDTSILYIQVKSTYNKQTEEMQLTMKKQDDKWYKTVYSKIGEVIDE